MQRVLIVDDDPTVRGAMVDVLREVGYETMAVGNGHEALLALKGFQADVIVADLFMPEKDGIELIFELRRVGCKLPIVAISGGTKVFPEMKDIVESLDDVSFIEKPFTSHVLIAAVNAKVSQI